MSSGLSERIANHTVRVAHKVPSTWPESKGQSSPTSIGNVAMVDLVDVNVVSLNVGRTIPVETFVHVVRCQPVHLVDPETG